MTIKPTITYHYADSSCAELILTNNITQEYPWHSHAKHWIIGIVFSGSVILSTRSESREFGQNDFFIVPPVVAHSLKVNSGVRLATLCLNTEESLEKNVNDLMNVLCHAPHNSMLEDTLSPSDIERLQFFAKQLAVTLVFEYSQTVLTPSIQAVAQRLQEHPEAACTLDEMAATAGYSRWHFIRLFQKELGLTPHAYLILCRLRRLRSMLRGDVSAVEAAVSTGFSDQSHMHRVFKLHHCLTPKQFREASINLEP